MAEKTVTVNKGTRIRAQWLQAQPLGSYSLAGAQMKVAARSVSVIGVVRHVRGDDPVAPKVIRFYVDPDEGEGTVRPPGCTCEKAHVEVDPKHVVEVLL